MIGFGRRKARASARTAAGGRIDRSRTVTFTFDGERFTGIEMEVDAVDGAHVAGDEAEGAALDREMLGQARDLEEGPGHVTIPDSGARRQRVRWPGVTSTSAGAVVRQSASTNGQRAAKRQPAGGRVMSGTRPSIEGRRSRLSSSRGIEPSRPTV